MQVEVDHPVETCTNPLQGFSFILAGALLILVHAVVLHAVKCVTLAVYTFAHFLGGGGRVLLLLRFIGSSRSGWLKQQRPLMVRYQYILKVKEREQGCIFFHI